MAHTKVTINKDILNNDIQCLDMEGVHLNLCNIEAKA